MAGYWASRLKPNDVVGTCVIVGSIAVSAGLLLKPIFGRGQRKKPWIASPRDYVSALVPANEVRKLPYPPDALPGGRDVQTPYGSIHVFEWGPEDGEKVLLIHGIGTPCVAFSNMAEELVRQGYRVMLFDLFGRGYSDAPVDVPYDIRLYATQILLVLASSALSWTGNDSFHLIGYSLGGGVAVSFTRYFASMVRSLTLVAGGGLIRRSHVSWKSRLLYTTGILPESLLEYLVQRRLSPRQAGGTVSEDTVAAEAAQPTATTETATTRRQKHSGERIEEDPFDGALLSKRRPGHTVASVMAWQVRHHAGFVPAFMSSIRHAPIYEQREDWAALAELLSSRRSEDGGDGSTPLSSPLPLPPPPSGLRGGRVLLVLGTSDPVIVAEELVHDAREVLGDAGFEVVQLDCGHEIAIARGTEVADAAVRFWRGRAG